MTFGSNNPDQPNLSRVKLSCSELKLESGNGHQRYRAMTSDISDFASKVKSKAITWFNQGKIIFVAKPCLDVIAVSIGHDAGEKLFQPCLTPC